MTKLALPAAGWQHEALARLSEWAAHEPAVEAVRAHGSASLGENCLDIFSDLDVSITAIDPRTCAERLASMIAGSFACIFASARHEHADGIVLRFVLTDLRRIDASITPTSVKSTQAGAETPPGAPSRDETDLLVNDFLFEAVLAAVKAARGDLLIASHLTFGLARHLLVAAMLLRDRDTGRRHHRYGGTGHDRWAAALGQVPKITGAGVITSLIRRYASVLRELADSLGRAPVDTGPLLALLDAVDSSA